MAYPPSVTKVHQNGEILTASDLNGNFTSTCQNLIPENINDYSSNAAQMQQTEDPFPAGVVSLPSDLAGELKRLRYQLNTLATACGKSQWYEDLLVSATAGANTIPVSGSDNKIAPGFDSNRPCFEATLTTLNQSFNSATATKLTLNTETFDTNSNYDSATNYRFTPTIAGKYSLTASAYLTGSLSGATWVAIYKNGAAYRIKTLSAMTGVANAATGSLTVTADANGTTDYFEVYAYGTVSGGSVIASCLGLNSTIGTYFSGCRVSV